MEMDHARDAYRAVSGLLVPGRPERRLKGLQAVLVDPGRPGGGGADRRRSCSRHPTGTGQGWPWASDTLEGFVVLPRHGPFSPARVQPPLAFTTLDGDDAGLDAIRPLVAVRHEQRLFQTHSGNHDDTPGITVIVAGLWRILSARRIKEFVDQHVAISYVDRVRGWGPGKRGGSINTGFAHRRRNRFSCPCATLTRMLPPLNHKHDVLVDLLTFGEKAGGRGWPQPGVGGWEGEGFAPA